MLKSLDGCSSPTCRVRGHIVSVALQAAQIVFDMLCFGNFSLRVHMKLLNLHFSRPLILHFGSLAKIVNYKGHANI